MSEKRESEPLFLTAIGYLPADLVAVVALVVAANGAVFVPILSDTPFRIAFGLALSLFVPGYACVAALFPETGRSDGSGENERSTTDENDDDAWGPIGRGIDGIERVALSFGLSVAVVPLIGLALSFTPFGIRLVPVAVGVSAFTLTTTALAAIRRWRLPATERFSLSGRWLGDAQRALFEPETRTDAVLNLVLAVSLVLATASVGYAVVVPQRGDEFTEFYLLTENENDTLVADGYPSEFTRGQGKPLVVGIDNREGEPMQYTVVVSLQRVERTGNETTVVEETRLHRFDARVGENETWTRPHQITPRMTGERLRLVYLLYQGSPPSNPTTDNAYRELHLWINVTSGR